MSEKPSFFAELKRRNVYKVAVAYAIVGWLLVQVATQVFPFFEIPNWAVRLVVLAQIQAGFGDFDSAIAAIPHLLEVPAGITAADLRLNPLWDPLRKDPRFQKFCEDRPK
jgi:hypothetical protein